MKKILFIVWLIPTITFSQNWDWAKGIKGNNYDMGVDIAVDASSNIYYTGSFSSDSIVFGTYNLKRNGRDGNSFLVKYDSLGNVLWAKSSALGYSGAHGLAIDNFGNAVITGNYYSPIISFGNDTLREDTTLNMNEVASIFLVKYDPSGNVLWAKNSKSTQQDFGYSLAIDHSNNIYLTGVYASPVVVFDTDTLYNTGSSLQDFFLAKYNPSGNLLWVKGVDSACGNCVAIDSYGNALVTGYFEKSTIFGTHRITGTGYHDMYLVKYDSSGNVLWVKTEGGLNDNAGNGVATDTHGNSYVTGYYEEPTNFGGFALPLNPSGYANIFIAKYDSAGNVLWAKGPGGNGNNAGYSVATDIKGNVYLKSASNAFSIAFDSINLSIPYSGHYYICLTKYDSIGNALCAASLPIGGNEWNRIANDAFGNTYFGGYYDDSPFIVGHDTLYKGAGYGNIFIAKVSLNYVPTPTCVASVTDSLFNISPLNWGILTHYSSQVTSAIWHWGDGTSSTGLYPSHTYTTAGWYNICVTAYASCGDSTTTCQNDTLYKMSSNSSIININVVSSANAIHQISNDNNLFSIYPNPTSDQFIIEATTTDKLTVDLYDVNGRHILSKSVSDKTKIDVSNLNEGIYNLKIKTEDGITNKKLVIVR